MILKNLSIIVAAKEEDKNLVDILPRLKNYSEDVIVVDGHSTDNTKNICGQHGVNFVLDHGLGKGDAQRVGAENAKNEYIIFFDADGSHDENDINYIYELITSLFISDTLSLVTDAIARAFPIPKNRERSHAFDSTLLTAFTPSAATVVAEAAAAPPPPDSLLYI